MPGERNQRADGGAHREEQRQQRQRIAMLAPGGLQIAVEQAVRCVGIAKVQEIHDREGEVVQQVGGRHRCIEFDGVEQHGLFVDHDDVGEMRIAMAAAHQSGGGAASQQGEMVAQLAVTELVQPIDVASRQRALLAELVGVAIDDGRN